MKLKTGYKKPSNSNSKILTSDGGDYSILEIIKNYGLKIVFDQELYFKGGCGVNFGSDSLSDNAIYVDDNGELQILAKDNLYFEVNSNGIYMPSNKSGTIALTSDLNNFITLDTALTISGAKTFNQPINADILGNATTADRLKNDVSGTEGTGWQPVKIENGVIKYYNSNTTYLSLPANGGTSTYVSYINGASWSPGNNIYLSASGNNQEWSFDITRNGYTGCYWHVWDSSLSTMLKVNADDGKVSAPYGFVGYLEGNISGNANTSTFTSILNPYSYSSADTFFYKDNNNLGLPKMIYAGLVSCDWAETNCKAGGTYGFPANNNANSLITIGTHPGSLANCIYGHQLGFSSTGRIYHRAAGNTSFTQAWNTLAFTSDIPTSLPASDVYSWAKANTKPSYTHNEIGAGALTIGDGANYLSWRTNTSWTSGVYYHTADNESVVFGNKNAVTSWMFVPGIDITAHTQWNTLSPGVQIKNKSLYINELIDSGVNPSYNFKVNGSSCFSGNSIFNSNASFGGDFILVDEESGNGCYIKTSTILDDIEIKLPSTSGTLALKSDLSNHVEMDSLTAGNLVVQGSSSLGTIASGTWNGTAISDSYIASAATWNAKQAAISDLGTIRTHASNGNTAYGWGNHASLGYVKSSGVTSVATGTGLTGGTITSTGTISINSTYQAYISHGLNAYDWGNHALLNYLKLNSDDEYEGIFKIYADGDLYTPYVSSCYNDGITYIGFDSDGGIIANVNYNNTNYTIEFPKKNGTLAITSDLNNYVSLTGALTISGAKTFSQAINADILGNATTADKLKNDDYYDYKYLKLTGGTLTGNLYAPAFYESSDIRYKNDICYTLFTAEELANLPVFTYRWQDELQIKIGSSAQDVELMCLYLVSDTMDIKTLDYAKLGALGSISLAREVVILKERINQLEQKLSEYGLG